MADDKQKVGGTVTGLKLLIIIILILMTMFVVLSSWRGHCESSPGSFGECRLAPDGRQVANCQTKPTDLADESTSRLLPSISTIAIFWYYLARKLIPILPFHGRWKAETP